MKSKILTLLVAFLLNSINTELRALSLKQKSSNVEQMSDVGKINQAYDTQNPNESLKLLRLVEDKLSLQDSVKNKYYLSFGIAYGKLGKADSSTYFLNMCIENAKKSGDDYSLMRAYNSTGVLLRIQGNHEGSLEAFQNAEKVTKLNISDRFNRAKSDILGNIGGIFYQIKDYNAAREYSAKGLEFAKQYKDTAELAYGYLRLAIVAQAQDSLFLSLAYNQAASQFLDVLGDFNTLAYVQSNLGNIYKDQGDFRKALTHHIKASKYAEVLGDVETAAHAKLSIGECHFQLEQYDSAKTYAQYGLQIAIKSNFPIHSKNAHNLLFKIAEKKGNYQIALIEKKLAVEVNDSLNAAEARERLAEVETKYETVKKEAEIERLSLENELNDSQLLAGGITAGLIIILLIVFFTLRSKKLKVEKEAQELQIEALKKRFIELHSSPADLAVDLDFLELNGKLHTPLTEREFEALKLSLEGKTNAEISASLFISVSTVKFHLRNTYSKMGVGNRKEAFQFVAKSS